MTDGDRTAGIVSASTIKDERELHHDVSRMIGCGIAAIIGMRPGSKTLMRTMAPRLHAGQ